MLLAVFVVEKRESERMREGEAEGEGEGSGRREGELSSSFYVD